MSQIAQYELAVNEAAELAGSGDLGVLATRARLGHAFAVAGRTAAAIDVLQENVAAAESLCGDDHPQVIVARNDVAWVMGKAGHLGEALARHEDSFADLCRLLGPTSHQAARAEVDLGKTLILAGRHDIALRHLEQALASIGARGPDHPDELACRASLAAAYAAVSRTKDAVDLAERTAAACSRKLPQEDLEAISCRTSLGAIYGIAGRSAEAVTMLTQARADFDCIFGPAHAETIRAGLALAVNLTRAGSVEQAVAEFEQTLVLAVRVLGQHHPLTLTGRDGLAAAYLMAGQTTQAVSMLEQAISDSPESLAGGMQDVARRALLARALEQTGRPGRTRRLRLRS